MLKGVSTDLIAEIFSEPYQITSIHSNHPFSPNLLVSGRYGKDNKPFRVKLTYYNYYYYTEENLPYHYPFYPKRLLKKSYKFKDKRSYKYVYEDGMSGDMRFIHDLYLYYPSSPLIKPRIWFFDIETMSLKRWNLKENIINAFTLYDTYTEKYISLIVIDKNKHKKDIGILNNGNKIIYFLPNERTLLEVVGQLIRKYLPDYISGWNILDFDIWYIANRIKTFYPDLETILSPFNEPFYEEERKGMRHKIYWIPGVGLCDYQLMYMQFEQNKKSSYKLDFIIKEEYKDRDDVGKIEFEGSLNELYYRDLDKFIEYNDRDVEILVMLDKKKGYIGLANSLKEISSHQTQHFNFRYTIKLTYGIVSRYLSQLKDPLAVKSKTFTTESGSYSGANVRVPIVGFHNWLTDLDASVDSESIIMIKNKKGVIYECRIEDYWVMMEEGDKILTLDVNENNELVEIFDYVTGISRHWWEEEMLEIEDENGNIIKITNNESIYVYDNKDNTIKLIEVKELLKDADRYLLIEVE